MNFRKYNKRKSNLIRSIQLVILVLLLHGCSGLETITVSPVKEITFKGFEGSTLLFEIALPVYNPNQFKIIVHDIHFTAFYNKSSLGYIMLENEFVIEKNQAKVYIIPLKLRLTNVLQGLNLLLNRSEDKLSKLNYEGHIEVKRFLMKKTFYLKSDEISAFLIR